LGFGYGLNENIGYGLNENAFGCGPKDQAMGETKKVVVHRCLRK
jgi:hypothetical protein